MKPRNPRRVVIEPIREIIRLTRRMVYVWGEPRSAYDEDARRYLRVPDAKQPENNPRDWDNLAKHMDAVAKKASEIASTARAHAHALRQ